MRCIGPPGCGSWRRMRSESSVPRHSVRRMCLRSSRSFRRARLASRAKGISEGVLARKFPLLVREELPEGAAERVAAYGVESVLADSLLHLREVARRRNEDSSRSRNTWTRIEISPDIVLSVRGITEEDEEVVERVRRAMARVVGRRTTDP